MSDAPPHNRDDPASDTAPHPRTRPTYLEAQRTFHTLAITPVDLALMTPAQIRELPEPVRRWRGKLQTSPTDLALMTRDDVLALPPTARHRRTELLLADTTTRWWMEEVARYFRVDRQTVAKWRSRQLNGEDPRRSPRMVLIPCIPGWDRPVWWMRDILEHAAAREVADAVYLVPFDERRRERRPATQPRITAPPQRIAPDDRDLASLHQKAS